jgi:hypothetical protein
VGLNAVPVAALTHGKIAETAIFFLGLSAPLLHLERYWRKKAARSEEPSGRAAT